jgi:tyrosine-protein kinase Etk/Wzc
MQEEDTLKASQPRGSKPSRADEVPAQEDEIDWFGVALTLLQNLRLLVLVPLLVGLLTLAWTYTSKTGYRASTRFLPPQQQQSSASAMLQSLGNLGGIVGGAAGIKNQGDQYVAFLKSQRVQYDLIERFKLLDAYKTTDKEAARVNLSEVTAIVNGLDGIITVSVVDADPQKAADLANGHVDAFRKLMGGMAVTEAQQRRVFFEKQLLAAKDNLINAEQELKRSGVAIDSLKVNPASAVESVARLKAAIAAQEIKLNALRSYLTDQAPEFRMAQAELRALQQQLAEQGQQGDAGVGNAGAYLSKYRNFKYQETLFEIISKQYEIARVDESREGAVIQVLDVAVPAHIRLSAHRIQRVSIAVGVTELLLLAWVFLRHSMRRLSDDESGEQKLGALRRAWRGALGFRV